MNRDLSVILGIGVGIAIVGGLDDLFPLKAGIKLAAPRTADLLPLIEVIEQLFDAAQRGADDDIILLIRRHVPEFQPEAGGPIRAVAS